MRPLIGITAPSPLPQNSKGSRGPGVRGSSEENPLNPRTLESLTPNLKGYIHSVTDAGGLPFIIAPVEDVVGIADKIDGLLLSGGDDIPPDYYGEALSIPPDTLKPVERERVDFEISLLKEMMKRQKPILGICYGMQLVNVALGGSLYQDIGIRAHNPPSPPLKKGGEGGFLNHKQGQHKIKIDSSFCFTFYIPQFAIRNSQFVNSSHHQAVKRLGSGLEVFALSEDGIIEGFYKRDYPFLVCIQWHPERGLGKTKGKGLKRYKELSSAIFRAFVDTAKRQTPRQRRR